MDTPAPTLALQGDMTIAQAAEHRTALLGALQQVEHRLWLDLGEIDAFDSAGVQLLLATERSLAARGADLALTAASPAVRDVLRCYGLHRWTAPATHGEATA